MARIDPDTLLADLDPEQREAVLAVTGPVVILAGAGSGKTRVISRRAAYAIATGVVDADQVLVVTFTDKAAGEMVERLRALGLPGVTARTFHAHALSQLRHFWPSRHDGEPLPDLLDSKLPILVPIARRLPGNYSFRPAKDLADEIEWAKARRIAPRDYEGAAASAFRSSPLPVDLMARVYADYERAKTRAKRLDFEDLLADTVALLESDEAAAAIVRARKRWFSVDEYQDTNPLQQRLLELWLGDRRDLCVVGDEDQTIYSFTGASSSFLTAFAARWPGAREVALVRNYRSTPQVLAAANRLIEAEGRAKRLVATRPDGPEPLIVRHPTAGAELASLAAWIGARLREGVAASEIAVLVRMNAQLADIEEALTRAGIAYQVRGVRFYDRPEVRTAVIALRRLSASGPEASAGPAATGPALLARIRAAWRGALGFEADAEAGEAAGADGGDSAEALERRASLDTLLAIVVAAVAADPSAGAAALLADLDARAAHERGNAAGGVQLSTLHRAKGLEWDAVALPALEEGFLPIRQALDDPDAMAEERRLLYVGITRARVHLLLSWAQEREVRGRVSRREVSRFLLDIRPRRVRELPGAVVVARSPRRSGTAAGSPGAPGAPGAPDDPLFAALRAWRTEQARSEAVPPYVIAPDATLTAIAEDRPRTLAALRRVKGMGPTRLERYGESILEVVEVVLARSG